METILKSNAMYTFIKNTLVNQVTLVGNMGDCPRIFTNDNGSKIARFSLATDVKCKEGMQQKVTEIELRNVIGL